MDNAFQELSNAYVWRETVRKREGIKLVGRLRRTVTASAAGNVTIGAGQTTFNIFTQLGLSGEPNAQLEKGNKTTITLSFAAPFGQTFTDATGTGVMTGWAGPITAVTINYATGDVVVQNGGGGFGASALTVTLAYYPDLPVMGIVQRELGDINKEQTVIFDTKYVYTYNESTSLFDVSSTSVWAGSDADFFWSSNYRGIAANSRLLFVTNFAAPGASANNRIRYTSDAVTWTDFTPAVDTTNFIFQAKIVIPYYGRLLMLNTYEGTAANLSQNYFNRCRFSQIGDPLQVDAFRSDIFGKGGFIDVPVNEVIVSAKFYKNTLIVFFERSTWQLRYVGEYGLPFLWERISSDFGSESKNSIVLFDQGVLAVGDKAIVTSSGNDVQRIDLEIPDTVFEFNNKDDGKERVQGYRDFQKEIVYWCYSDGGLARKFPNYVLLYNYRNNTWAIFRDNVTAFGVLNNAQGDSWDSPISWDGPTSWDTYYPSEFLSVISGNQHGFIHYYQYPTDFDTTQQSEINQFLEQESAYIKGITRNNAANLRINLPNHNLETADIIYITGMLFVNTSTGATISTNLNNRFYYVVRVDNDNFDLILWNQVSKSYVGTDYTAMQYSPAPGTGTYVGGGLIALFPKMDIYTKDFNPYADKGIRFKSSYTDFQFDGTPNSFVTVNGYVNTAFNQQANFLFNNTPSETSWNQQGFITAITQANPCVITSPNHGLTTGRQVTFSNINGTTELNGLLGTVTYIDSNSFSVDINSSAFTTYTYGGQWYTQDQNVWYISGQNYAWHRFYANLWGQYITFEVTYSDELMNNAVTHQADFQMNAMILWTKPAGRFP